jgi:predicted AAA+ superfamily ATPase
MSGYHRRVLDQELDELLPQLPAIAIEGPKAVGKTATASRRAATVVHLDRAGDRALLDADPERLEREPAPVLLDEWQRHPSSWDLVRRSVDANSQGGRFLLTGSATPRMPPTHSGAGRIVRLRMRPMSLAERGLPVAPTVRLAELLAGDRSAIGGDSSLDLRAYTQEILSSGFPAIRPFEGRARVMQLDGYLARVVDADMPEQGHRVNRPATLRAWLSAYAAATSTTASYNSILDAATAGDTDKPAKTTTIAYREALTKIWLLDELPGWVPGSNHLTRLAQAPKHHLADPALAARLLGATEMSLLRGHGPSSPGKPFDGVLLGALFESLVAQSVRVYAQPLDATVHHLRTQNGDHEVDLIVEGSDRRVVAFEVKLAPVVEDRDVAHLRWLATKLGDDLADAAVITTGRHAFRRRDGIAVIPATLLGP